jgi:hypothetical protein
MSRKPEVPEPGARAMYRTYVNSRARVLLTVSIFRGVWLMRLVWHPVVAGVADALPTTHEGVADHPGKI